MDKVDSGERTILVALDSPALGDNCSDEWSLDELEELLDTAGGICVAKVVQKRDIPDPATFIGEGKADEVKLLASQLDASLVIFDHELSPSQMRNLSNQLDMTVLDRTALILDIFASRARTSEGRIQIALAQYKYMYTMLSGLGKSMSRLGGGIFTRGPGETQLETNRRHIRRLITNLEDELADVRRVRSTQRTKRINSGIPMVAIVGYTNSGKSTLLNKLTNANIQANNRLFDTLDPTTRRYDSEDGFSLLFSDTVGFIRKLPHGLVEAFKATLEELKYADIILHVVDASNPNWREQSEVVEKLCAELEVNETPRITLYNKCDKAFNLPPLHAYQLHASALTGDGLDFLITMLRTMTDADKQRLTIQIPYSKAALLDHLYSDARVESVEYTPDSIDVVAVCDSAVRGRLEKYHELIIEKV